MQDFEGRVAFVTGGARGIGFAIARALLEEGVKVMICDIHEDELAQATKDLSAFGEAEGILCDVADADAVRRASDAVTGRFGKVHVLVNNAGVVIGGQSLIVQTL